MADILFSPIPGTHERQLQRRYTNILFPEDLRNVIQIEITAAQRKDDAETSAFEKSFKDLVKELTELGDHAESEVLLLLKERADKLYEAACGLGGDQDEYKQALKRIVQLMMQAVRKGAAGDAKAMQELHEEDIAREAHYSLLEFKLITDLLRPDSQITETELIPVLLTERTDAVKACMILFDSAQKQALHEQAQQLLDNIAPTEKAFTHAQTRLNIIKNSLAKE